jgi:hypothetical protein
MRGRVGGDYLVLFADIVEVRLDGCDVIKGVVAVFDWTYIVDRHHFRV